MYMCIYVYLSIYLSIYFLPQPFGLKENVSTWIDAPPFLF